MKVTDVVRASLSEVEGYEARGHQGADGEVSLAGQAVNDVIHLLAELVENATLVLRPRHPGHRLRQPDRRRGVMVSVTDSGIGMNPDELIGANELAAGQPAGRRRVGVPPDGPVRGRPARAAQRHPGADKESRRRRPHRDGAAARVPDRLRARRGAASPRTSTPAGTPHLVSQGPDVRGGLQTPPAGLGARRSSAAAGRPASALPSPGPLGPSTGPYHSPSPAPVQHTGPQYGTRGTPDPSTTSGPGARDPSTRAQPTGPQQHTGPQHSLFGPPPRQQAPVQGPNGAPGGQRPTMFGPPPPAAAASPAAPAAPEKVRLGRWAALGAVGKRDADVTGPLPAVREPAGTGPSPRSSCRSSPRSSPRG